MSQIRVALADDHPLVLTGIATLLCSAPDITLVGEATTGTGALQLIEEALPDVAVIDLSMPKLGGPQLAQEVARRCPCVKVLVLTVHESRAYVQLLLQAGARGYLLKRSAPEDLLRAIRAVAGGSVYLDPAIAEKALPVNGGPTSSTPGDHQELSAREEGVLKLLAHGFGNKEIAREMNLSPRTVETYKARATEKLGLRSRADIVRYGASRGWLDNM